MWVNIESDLTLTSPDQEFLDNWIKYSEDGQPFKHRLADVDLVTGIPVATGGTFPTECSYEEITHESSLYDHIYVNEKECLVFKDIFLADKCVEDYSLVQVYGVTDFNSEEDAKYCVETLLKHYPELKLLGDVPDRKFLLNITLVGDDFRFHKNGGYRGKDEVGEHVYDSPSEEYMMFQVLELRGE